MLIGVLFLILILIFLFGCQDMFLNTTNKKDSRKDYLLDGLTQISNNLKIINANYLETIQFYDKNSTMDYSMQYNIDKVNSFILKIDSLDPTTDINDLIIQAEQIYQLISYQGPTETKITGNNLRIIIDQVVSFRN